MANMDGVQAPHVNIALVDKKKERTCKFDAFQFFGLLAYFLVLYSIYAGFFAVLLVIALNIRKDNYLHLNKKLTGNYLSGDAYTTPWLWLRDNTKGSR